MSTCDKLTGTLTLGATMSGGLLVAKGDKGDAYVITDADKQEIKEALSGDINKLKSDLNYYLCFSYYKEVDHTDKSNYIWNNTTMSESFLQGFSYTEVPVTVGEVYKVSGFGGSIYNPVFASETEAILVFELNTDAEVPNGATRLIVNGRPMQDISIDIRKLITNEKSESFLTEYEQVKESAFSANHNHIGVSVGTNGETRVFQNNYDGTHDFETIITKKSGNNLPDIYGFYKVDNGSEIVLVETNSTEEVITANGTDFLSPSTLYAVNNVDGDFPDFTSGKITGGWHRYNSSTTSGTATARNVSYKVFCDGKRVNNGENARGSEVVIDIVNRLQASNTEKEDGTGREVVEQHFRLIFGNGHGCTVDGEITALEDIKYEMYYGISSYFSGTEDVYFVGCRANRGGKSVTEVNRCGDKYCTGVKQIGTNDTYEFGIDSLVDLGTQYANNWANSCIMSSRKAYMVLIFANNTDENRLSLTSGSKAYWKGYYKCYPTVPTN